MRQNLKNLSKETGKEPQESYHHIQQLQKSFRKTLVNTLKEEHPELKQFYELVSSRTRLSGMFAEKADKEILAFAKLIQLNKKLLSTLKVHLPTTFKTLNHKLTLALRHERAVDRER